MTTAAVVIDNFLDSGKWNTIQSGISNILNSSTYFQGRDDPHAQINLWIEEKLKGLNLWQTHWDKKIKLFSNLVSIPKEVDVESLDPTNGGYHREQGGYIYYIHPAWDSSWGGNLKFRSCTVEKVEPKPNRFIWVNPDVWHGIEVVNSTASTNRVTAVAWPTGILEYASADIIINKL